MPSHHHFTDDDDYDGIDIHKVADGLYLSSLDPITDKGGRALLKKLQIQRILSLLDETHSSEISSALRRLSDEDGINCMLIETDDYYPQDLLSTGMLDSALAFIAEAEGQQKAILVHCEMGRSRSVTCVCAHLMVKHKWSSEQSIQYVKGRRFCAGPNASFRLQLKLFELAGYMTTPAAIMAVPAYEEFASRLANFGIKLMREPSHQHFADDDDDYDGIDISKVAEGLYLSSLDPITEKGGRALLKKLQIRRVLSLLHDGVPSEVYSALKSLSDDEGINCKLIETDDCEAQDLLSTGLLDSALAFIAEAETQQQAILVHCEMGISRSVTCVCAHLMQKHKWSFLQSVQYVKERRVCANPNASFRFQLKLFELAGYVTTPAAIMALPEYEAEFAYRLADFGIKLMREPSPTPEEVERETSSKGERSRPKILRKRKR